MPKGDEKYKLSEKLINKYSELENYITKNGRLNKTQKTKILECITDKDDKNLFIKVFDIKGVKINEVLTDTDSNSDELSEDQLNELLEGKDNIDENELLDNQNSNIGMEKDKEYLSKYLSEIKSTSGNSNYKRVCLSPLRYAGGKTKAVGLILENLPVLKEKKIVSPFFGGGSFEIVLSSQLNYEVIGYDVFEMLTNFWDIVINKRDEFIDELNKFKINNDEFTKNRHILLSYWDKVKPDDLNYKTIKKVELTEKEKNMLDNDKLMQAVYYYYNMSLSYGPMFLGWPSSNEIKLDKFKRKINRIKEIDFKNLSVKCSDFKDVIKKHSNDFLFLDPPYLLGEDSKMFKGMYPNCNFAIHHNNFEHEIMRDLLKQHKGGFFITYNDCPTIREWYKEFKQVYPSWQYTYGQGETRVGKNRKEQKKDNDNENTDNNNETKDNVKESHEIFIICDPQ